MIPSNPSPREVTLRSWLKQLARRGISPLADIVPLEIEEYAAAHSVAESDVCRLIREETYRTQDCPQMVVGPLEAAFLKVMVLAVRARRGSGVGNLPRSRAPGSAG